MEEPERLRAIGYVRVSKADKKAKAERLSLDAQTDAIRRAAVNNGWELLDVMEDNGKTGTNLRREGLDATLAMLKAKEADVLVVAKYDRLSRNTVEFGTLIQRSIKEEWSLSVLDQRVDTSTAVGKYMARIMAANAEFERDLISERTRDALAVLKANGKQLGRPSEISVEIRRKVKRLHRQGSSATAIARRLTEQGYETPSGKATWHHSVIVDLLKRQAVEVAS